MGQFVVSFVLWGFLIPILTFFISIIIFQVLRKGYKHVCIYPRNRQSTIVYLPACGIAKVVSCCLVYLNNIVITWRQHRAFAPSRQSRLTTAHLKATTVHINTETAHVSVYLIAQYLASTPPRTTASSPKLLLGIIYYINELMNIIEYNTLNKTPSPCKIQL